MVLVQSKVRCIADRPWEIVGPSSKKPNWLPRHPTKNYGVLHLARWRLRGRPGSHLRGPVFQASPRSPNRLYPCVAMWVYSLVLIRRNASFNYLPLSYSLLSLTKSHNVEETSSYCRCTSLTPEVCTQISIRFTITLKPTKCSFWSSRRRRSDVRLMRRTSFTPGMLMTAQL